MAKYLITGGCGFIGTHLTRRLLEDGHKVTVIDNFSNGKTMFPEAQYIKENIVFYKRLQKYFEGYDACIHLAAIPTVEMNLNTWMSIHRVNLTGTLNVFKAAIAAGNVPVIYASSCGVYGNADSFPLAEDLFINPISSYGCDKFSAELNAHFLNTVYDLPSIGLRLFNAYGPGQAPNSPYSGVITRFISRLLSNKSIAIYGDGQQTRDFVYIDDIVNALIHAIKIIKTKAEVVNICTEIPTTVNDLADKIAAIIKKQKRVKNAPPRAVDVKHSWGSTKKMHSLGYNCAFSLEDGLKATVRYFEQLPKK